MNTGTHDTTKGLQDNPFGNGHFWLSCTFVKYAIKVIFISMLRMDIAIAPSPGSLQAKCHSELHRSKPTGCLAIIGISI